MLHLVTVSAQIGVILEDIFSEQYSPRVNRRSFSSTLSVFDVDLLNEDIVEELAGD